MTAALSKSQPWPIGRWADLVDTLSACAELPRSETLRRLRYECESLGNNVREEIAKARIEPFAWTDRLVEWYRSTDAFLFESLVWNNTSTKIAMRNWIVDFLSRAWPNAGRVFCFGDGLGFDTAALASAGHRLVYHEPSKHCRAFAERVFRNSDVSVDLVDAMSDLEPASFDAVVCLDVLEHVPDPPAMVRQFAALVKPGGLVIAHAPFWYLNSTTPTHLDANRRFAGRHRPLYSEAGLQPIAGRILWNPIVAVKASAGDDPRIATNYRARLALGSLLLRVPTFCNLVVSPITRLVLRTEVRGLRKYLPNE